MAATTKRTRSTIAVAAAVVAALLWALLVPTAAPAGAATADEPQASVTDEVLAGVADGESAFVIANLAAPEGAPDVVASTAQSVLDGLPEGSFQGEANAEDLPFVTVRVDAEALDALRADPNVTSVVLNNINTPSLVNSVPAVGADVARTAGYDGAGTAVAILDGGVQWYHPFFSDGAGGTRVVSESCFSGAGGSYPYNVFPLCPNPDLYSQTGLGASNPCNGLSGNIYPFPCGHGTHVAGIAAGGNAGNNGTSVPRWGVAPKAKILASNVFSLICQGSITQNGGCTTGFVYGSFDSDIMLALSWVDGLEAVHNVAAVNMSLGGSTTFSSACDAQTDVDTPINTLRSHGVATVIASGNDGVKSGISSPACISSAISVGSSDSLTNAASGFSNSASILTMLAPGDRNNGVGIVSSVPTTTPPYSGYSNSKGTSMAAPHVAGAIAVLHQVRPDLNVAQLTSALTSTGPGVTDTNGITKPRLRLDLALASVAKVPDAPTGVTAAAADGRITASWVAPASNGGSPITSYTATLSPGGTTCTWTTGPLGCSFPGLTNGTPYSVTVHATNAKGNSPESAASPSAAPSLPYTPIVPTRFMDTRTGGETFDDEAEGLGALPVSGSYDLQVTGRDEGLVPSTGVAAVVVNVTVVSPPAGGYLTVYPTGVTAPNASNLNFAAGQTIANLAVVQVGAGGKITVKNSQFGSANVIVDVVGWYPTGSAYTSVVPTRYMDTRPAGGATFDDAAEGAGAITGTLGLKITGRTDGVTTPVPSSGVAAVILNVTVTSPSSGGYLTVFPTGVAKPNASNLNFDAGQTIANLVVVKVGTGGQVAINNAFGSAHVIVDVVGWVPTGSGMNSLVPARVMDTRAAPSGVTIDGLFQGAGPIAPGGTRTLRVAGRGGVPAMGASAVALNVTVAGPAAGGFLTVYPSGVAKPNASNVNFTAGQVIPNMVIVKVGADGQIVIANSPFGNTPVIVDVVGWYP